MFNQEVTYPRTYYPNFITNRDTLFEKLLVSLERSQYPITMFGKTYLQPRLICFMWDNHIQYRYSKTTLVWIWRDSTLWELKDTINSRFWLHCNSVLCNLYRDWDDSMWRHSDDEAELWSDPIIVSITLWQARSFKMRNKHTKETVTLVLEHGSLLLMWAWSQIDREHCVPKTKSAKNKRINLTFRTIIS